MALIIADSTCDLTLAQANELNIEMLSLSVNFGEESYLDKREITNEEFYEKLAAAPELPTTSLLSPGDFAAVFDAHPNEELVVLTLSSILSGTYQSAVLAKEASGRDDIYLVDTRTVCAALGLLVRRAAWMAREGSRAADIAAAIEALAARSRLIGVVDTLHNLVKGGRLGKVSGYVGGMLNIKPVLMIEDGAVKPILKARGERDALSKMRMLVFEQFPIDARQPVAFACSAGGQERLALFMDTLGLTGPVSDVGSVVGTHAGPGTVMIAYFEK
ncbi:MAG TPA: DegV family protein [Clostridia bacterium]|jgi:DegV family protein with EDD domain|nr:DegV family protein [Clostridia bacterium]HOS18641.1 DegV family protein [Clostridia bacterium]